MKNLGILLKNSFNCMLGALQGKRARKKVGLIISICALVYVGICAVFALQIKGLFQVMSEIGLKQIPLFNSVQVLVLLVLVLAFQSISEKSKTNDSDLLLSMPIKKVDIVIAKTLSKYLFNLVLDSMIVIPTLVLYSVYFGASASVILWGIFLLITMPLLGVGINYILNFLIVRLFNRFKYSNVIKTVFALILFGGFVAIYVYNSANMGLQDFTTIDAFLNKNFFIGWCVRLMTENNLLCLVYLSLMIFGIFALGVCLYSLIFGKTFLSYKDKGSQVKFSSPSKFNGLLSKEIKKYFTTPILMINTVIGPIMLVILSVYVAIKGMSFYDIFMLDKTTMFAILTLIYLFMSSMTLISCVMISLEGKYLWILRSTPANTNTILLSKSLINMIIFFPVEILTSIVVCLSLKAGVLEWIMILTLPNLLCVILSFGGTYINLLLPKLNWETEAQVVKQSLSLIVTMFLGLFLVIIPVILNLCNLSLAITFYITLSIYGVLAVLAIVLLFTNGKKKFNKLEC